MSKEKQDEYRQEMRNCEAKIKEEEAKEPKDQHKIDHLWRLYGYASESLKLEREIEDIEAEVRAQETARKEREQHDRTRLKYYGDSKHY